MDELTVDPKVERLAQTAILSPKEQDILIRRLQKGALGPQSAVDAAREAAELTQFDRQSHVNAKIKFIGLLMGDLTRQELEDARQRICDISGREISFHENIVPTTAEGIELVKT